MMQKNESPRPPYALWEWAILALALLWCLWSGLRNLGVPSLWHDELVHVFVAQNFANGHGLTLPSGAFYPSSSVYNLVLAAFIKVLGSGEFVVRLPSVLLAGLNTLLLYGLTRKLLGRNAALCTLFLFCISPWQIAWARQARMYELQVLAYLVMLWSSWQAWTAVDTRKAIQWAVVACVGYALGVLCSYHSILALGTVGGLALIIIALERNIKTRYGVTVLACCILGVATLAVLLYNPNSADQSAVFETGIGGRLVDPQRLIRNYYLRWLMDNHSLGLMITVVVGTVALLWREGRRGWLAALAFWVPLIILSLFIGYRRPRFLFFAFPLYCMLAGYGVVMLGTIALHARKSMWYLPLTLVIVVFAMRLGQSTLSLVGDSLETASGTSQTLARRIPQWREPCTWVKEHATPDDVILTTTWLPVLYYTGRVDNWFPNRYQLWEKQESGVAGLGSLDELKTFIAEHPRGYYISESRRFEYWRHYGGITEELNAEFHWIEEHMTRLDDASSEDVTVYRWGE